ncbi:formylglycine-generating enzyme family protein [Neolewinella agarilytica]|uniref:formylglycine-generating enzyme family protein n=1 Tax=Neolewinella agarilytica TaxID=478744 RepID=UPI0023527E96|nr:SUMF1/EgtB/PvdO family nonheme iron enzyme [Neolewinella agarilytica]
MRALFIFLLCHTLLYGQSVDSVNIPGSEVTFTMVHLPGGDFKMGPRGQLVTLSAFAIGSHEVTHDAFRLFQRRDNDNNEATTDDYDADAITRPSPPYLDFTYGMGTRGGYPQVNTTQQAALRYCEWLYQKTGRFFRLPTEAEWEYACLADTEEPELDERPDYGWFFENSEEAFHKTGEKKPNAWGLYDMLGNVSEWTLDHYASDYFEQITKATVDPWIEPTRKHSRGVRGGHFDMDMADAGCRVREKSSAKWQARDPQIPKSKWWNVDSPFLGFRIVSPADQPGPKEVEDFFIKAIID